MSKAIQGRNTTIVRISDLPSDIPGKTWREKNFETPHTLPIGTLVQIKDSGIRLFIAEHSRDCDGTPLYELTWHDNEETFNYYAREARPGFRSSKASIGGYSRESLIPIAGITWGK